METVEREDETLSPEAKRALPSILLAALAVMFKGMTGDDLVIPGSSVRRLIDQKYGNVEVLWHGSLGVFVIRPHKDGEPLQTSKVARA